MRLPVRTARMLAHFSGVATQPASAKQLLSQWVVGQCLLLGDRAAHLKPAGRVLAIAIVDPTTDEPPCISFSARYHDRALVGRAVQRLDRCLEGIDDECQLAVLLSPGGELVCVRQYAPDQPPAMLHWLPMREEPQP